MRQTLSFVLSILVTGYAVAGLTACKGGNQTGGAHSVDLSKAAFEMRTQAIVWDIGATRGQVDAGDDITDLTQVCVANLPDSKHLVQTLADRHQDPAQVMAQSARLLARLGVGELQVAMNPVTVLEQNPGGPTYFLFPELHVDPSDRPRVALHESRAIDMWTLAERLIDAHKIINTAEGPLGTWPEIQASKIMARDERSRYAKTLLATIDEVGAIFVGELFFGQIKSVQHDNNDLAIRYALSLQMLGEDKTDWATDQATLAKPFPVRTSMVNPASYRGFFDQAQRLSGPELLRLNSQLCELRSERMTTYTQSVAASEHADVVFMTFGALHTHGVLEQLRKIGASAIVYSPNFR